MIGKTRRKFIAVAMLSAILVLAVLVGVINWLNFSDMDETAGILLEFLAENGGAFPVASAAVSEEIVVSDEPASGEPSGAMPESASGEPTAEISATASAEPAEETSSTASAELGAEIPAASVPESAVSGEPAAEGLLPMMAGEMPIHRRGEPPRGMDDRFTERIIREVFTYETPHETRYFSVLLDEEGGMISVDTTQIAAVVETDAEAMACALHAQGKTAGYEGNYKYLAREGEEGTLYVFLDCTKDLVSARRFLNISVLVSAAGVAVLLLLVVLLSGWAIRPMVTAYEKQKTFITNAGHELKTPLAVIGSCTEVLELEQGESKWTDGIRTQVTRMGDLVQNLIALARLDEGESVPRKEFDLAAALEEELEMFLPLAEQRGLSLRWEIREPILFTGSESDLRQLIGILADNAVKYTPEGEILFRLSRKGKKILLESENPAEGFEPGEQRQLFERFYRGDASHNQENSGYGVGLSIANAIVAAHGGKITATSEDGKSLRIAVSL